MSHHDQAEVEAASDALLEPRLLEQRARTLALRKARLLRPGKWTLLGMCCGLAFGPLLGFVVRQPWPIIVGVALGTLLGRLADYQAARKARTLR